MSYIFMFWLLILVVANVAWFSSWFKIKGTTCTGAIGELLMSIVIAIVLVIADISTFVSWF